MRSPQKNNRTRGRGRSKGNGNSANRVYESTGPEGKVRGTPQQIIEKYLSLARDAQTSGDRVIAENFLQHAEHYQRILIQAAAAQQAHDQRREEASDGSNGSAKPERTVAEPNAPQPDVPAVDGLQTIDAGDEESNIIIGAEEMATSQPAKQRRNGSDLDQTENSGDAAPTAQQDA